MSVFGAVGQIRNGVVVPAATEPVPVLRACGHVVNEQLVIDNEEMRTKQLVRLEAYPCWKCMECGWKAPELSPQLTGQRRK